MEITREAYHGLIQAQWESRDKTNDTKYEININKIITEIIQLSAVLETWVTSHNWFNQ